MKRYLLIFILLFSSSCIAQEDTSFEFALPSANSSQPITHWLTFQSYDTAGVIEVLHDK